MQITRHTGEGVVDGAVISPFAELLQHVYAYREVLRGARCFDASGLDLCSQRFLRFPLVLVPSDGYP